MSDSATPWTVTHQASLSLGFPRHEYWGGLPFPPLGDLHTPGTEPTYPELAGRFFTAEPPGKPKVLLYTFILAKKLNPLRNLEDVWQEEVRFTKNFSSDTDKTSFMKSD